MLAHAVLTITCASPGSVELDLTRGPRIFPRANGGRFPALRWSGESTGPTIWVETFSLDLAGAISIGSCGMDRAST